MARRKQNQERLVEIYSKALDLFVKNGYDATSMAMIAKASGMSQGNLFHYCLSKENLLYSIHLDYLQKHFIPFLEEAEQLSSAMDRIAFVLRKVTLLNTSSRASRVLLHEIHNLNKVHYNEVTTIWRRAYELFRSTVEELQEAGRARKFRSSFLTFLAFGMPFFTIYWWDYSRQNNAEELAEVVAQTFLNSLTPEAPYETKGRKEDALFL